MKSQSSLYAGLRDYLESPVSVDSVRGKSAPVQRENPVGLQLFAQNNQRGVGEIHWDIAVLFHQRRNPLQAGWGRRHQLKRASEDKLKGGFLSPPLWPDQVKCLGEHRFGGDNRTGPTFQRRYAVRVRLLVSVHESHEGPGIQQQLIGHGATGGSGNRGGAGPDRAGRWQYCRGDRGRVRSDAPLAVYPESVPRLRGPLPNACASSVWLSALAWRPDRPTIAWSTDVPYRGLSMQCSVRQRLAKVHRRPPIPPNLLVRADKVIQ